jgi:hypothetical protein
LRLSQGKGYLAIFQFLRPLKLGKSGNCRSACWAEEERRFPNLFLLRLSKGYFSYYVSFKGNFKGTVGQM